MSTGISNFDETYQWQWKTCICLQTHYLSKICNSWVNWPHSKWDSISWLLFDKCWQITYKTLLFQNKSYCHKSNNNTVGFCSPQIVPSLSETLFYRWKTSAYFNNKQCTWLKEILKQWLTKSYYLNAWQLKQKTIAWFDSLPVEIYTQ